MAEEIQIVVTLDNQLQVEVELPIVVSSGSVSIVDQDNNLIDTVASGDTYQVLVFSGIVDNGGPYTNSIVDTGA